MGGSFFSLKIVTKSAITAGMNKIAIAVMPASMIFSPLFFDQDI